MNGGGPGYGFGAIAGASPVTPPGPQNYGPVYPSFSATPSAALPTSGPGPAGYGPSYSARATNNAGFTPPQQTASVYAPAPPASGFASPPIGQSGFIPDPNQSYAPTPPTNLQQPMITAQNQSYGPSSTLTAADTAPVAPADAITNSTPYGPTLNGPALTPATTDATQAPLPPTEIVATGDRPTPTAYGPQSPFPLWDGATTTTTQPQPYGPQLIDPQSELNTQRGQRDQYPWWLLPQQAAAAAPATALQNWTVPPLVFTPQTQTPQLSVAA